MKDRDFGEGEVLNELARVMTCESLDWAFLALTMEDDHELRMASREALEKLIRRHRN